MCDIDCEYCAWPGEARRYKKLHEAELGICEQHCDVVRELRENIDGYIRVYEKQRRQIDELQTEIERLKRKIKKQEEALDDFRYDNRGYA